MSLARKNFLDRLAVFKRALKSDDLKDDGIAQSPHNERARILRNGISIIAFTILEDFIKERTGEALELISNSSILFNLLSPQLQLATTLGAMKSVTERAQIMKRTSEDWLSFIQTEAKNIASSSGFPFTLSKFSFGWEKSNLGKDDIKSFMSAFNVEGGWNTIQSITAKANVTLTAPDTIFTNAALRRHKAAHTLTANSLYNDLEDYSRDVKSLSFAYDVLISKGIHNIIKKNSSTITASIINIRFLVKDTVWKEFNSNSNRPSRIDSNYNRLLSKAKKRATKRNEVLVIKKDSNEIENWFIF